MVAEQGREGAARNSKGKACAKAKEGAVSGREWPSGEVLLRGFTT